MINEPIDYHANLAYKICVSGAAETKHCGEKAFELGEEIGREIVRHKGVCVTGATTGFPYWAAKGAKSENGFVIGFSPASTEKEHIDRFNLPTDHHDMIVYTGFHYSGRNLILTRACDAVIIGCGRMGTMNEFTIAFEDSKPIGILEGDWETDEVLRNMIEKSHRAEEMKSKIVFSSSPKELLDKLVAIIDEDKRQTHESHTLNR